jgi:hypothetical protein
VCIGLLSKKEVREIKEVKNLGREKGWLPDRAGRVPASARWKKEERRALTPDCGGQAEGAYGIRESKVLTDFGRWIVLHAEFCFDQSENYGKDDRS